MKMFGRNSPLLKRAAVLNSLSGIILQLISIISGLIIPRLIILKLGSEVNGLVVSLTQFLNWIYIFEGGLEVIIMSKLYKPLREHDLEKVSSVVYTAQRFYKRISYIFILYTIILAISYSLLSSAQFSISYVSSLTLLIAFSIFVQYNMTVSWQQLLRADKKGYIVAAIQSLVIILNTVLSVIVLNLMPNIHLLKFVTAVVYLLQPLLNVYFVKRYFKLGDNAKIDKTVLKNRWNGLGINVANFVHMNTDVAILTLFTSFELVSVYSIYALVTTGLRQIVMSVSAGISPSFGHVYASGNQTEIRVALAKYEFVVFFVTSLLFTVGGLMITPFVQLYIHGADAGLYYQPLLGTLLICGEALACIREPYINLAYLNGNLKSTTKFAFFESGINIIISLIFVPRLGIVGVAIGTFVAMIFRTVVQIVHIKCILPEYSLKSTFKKGATFLMAIVASVLFCVHLLPFDISSSMSWLDWVYHGIVYSVITFLFLVVANAGSFDKLKSTLVLLRKP